MKTCFALLTASLCLFLCTSPAQGHFLWLVPADESGSKVSLYFSEGPEPDDPALLNHVASVQVVPFRSQTPEPAMGFEFEQGNARLVASHAGASAWSLTHTFGTHGREEKNLIVYSAASVACRRPGMEEKDAISLSYNPASNTWERLGSLAGVSMNGFGAAATDFQGKLIVSTIDGSIQEFEDATGTWSVVGQLPTGRFFHRMLPVSKDTVGIFGGANMSVGKFHGTEFFTITPN